MSRRERKKEETRSTIVNCAISFFKEKGFYETSMEEIAEKADVSKGTLYNYFQDKESILVDYFQLLTADYAKESLKSSRDITSRLNNLLDFIYKLFSNDQDLAEIYFRYRIQTPLVRNPFDDPKRSGLENSVLATIEEAQKSGELRCDIPALLIARNLQFLTISFFISNIYSKEPFEIGTVKTQIIELFLNGSKL